ncbi:hypothetical protein DQ237_05750 [Blastococcus sp. TF02-8]|uniref:ATP-grasp domain-containing protein n=1 Tax=Blastococcus sp. TF02-8 TaxID=2250574 RepID=UPI000DE9BF13|nr:hypothetical protein [Blastococcus sp. TF02-8]RBY97089.1 hypothetical protein DQ237_05750 [Blastococcus sp. TF02-8]
MLTGEEGAGRSPRIGIVTVKDDLHAHVVAHHLALEHGVTPQIIEADTLSTTPGLTWRCGDGPPRASVRAGARRIDVGALDVLWWRRVNYPQVATRGMEGAPAADLINNDQSAALHGALATDFRGRWIDHPDAVRAAENKLVQLSVARDLGLRIPATLVSQDPGEVRAFIAEQRAGVIAKPVRGTHRAGLLAGTVDGSLSDGSIMSCPTIYQELVPGSRHLRVHVFGDTVVCAQIDSPLLDWRADLRTGIRVVGLDDALESLLQQCLQRLGLTMGVFDLKVTDDGEVVWLEVNPQGQFLFVEALTGAPLGRTFARFLLRAASARSTVPA